MVRQFEQGPIAAVAARVLQWPAWRRQGWGADGSIIIQHEQRSTAPPLADAEGRPFGRVLARNIETLVALRQRENEAKGRQDRVADAITRFAGSMTFVYIHAALFGAWIASNLGFVPGLPRFDPTLVLLATIASIEAIFLSTFVLISQNRMQAQDEKRAELDLQISLLAEHEITRTVQLLDAIAERVGVERGPDPQVEEAKQDVDPRVVYEAIQEREARATNGHSS